MIGAVKNEVVLRDDALSIFSSEMCLVGVVFDGRIQPRSSCQLCF